MYGLPPKPLANPLSQSGVELFLSKSSAYGTNVPLQMMDSDNSANRVLFGNQMAANVRGGQFVHWNPKDVWSRPPGP